MFNNICIYSKLKLIIIFPFPKFFDVCKYKYTRSQQYMHMLKTQVTFKIL